MGRIRNPMHQLASVIGVADLWRAMSDTGRGAAQGKRARRMVATIRCSEPGCPAVAGLTRKEQHRVARFTCARHY